MKIYNLNEMNGGWFIGDFEPSIFRQKDFEVGIKYYTAGVKERLHVNKVSTEITVVISGRIQMANIILKKGEIIVLNPNDESEFEALEDSALAIVKFPSVPSDKYLL